MRALFVLLTVLLAGQAAPREVMVLDLTGPPPKGPPPTPLAPGPTRLRSFIYVGRASDGGGGGPEQWPIRTTLLGITPGPGPRPQWIVEVRLEALREVQLPRSSNHRQVDPDPAAPLPSIRTMFFALELADGPPGSPRSVTGHHVSGSDLAPGSLFTLQAGESIRVRYATLVGEMIKEAKPGEPIAVRARVSTLAGSYSHPSLRSENVIEVPR